jgi:hypothetical protein
MGYQWLRPMKLQESRAAGGLFGQDKAPTLYGAGYPASDA